MKTQIQNDVAVQRVARAGDPAPYRARLIWAVADMRGQRARGPLWILERCRFERWVDSALGVAR